MKKLSIIISFLLMVTVVSAQTVVRNGNTFSTTSTRSTSRDTLVTKFTFEDSKGTKYPIIINKQSGRCYVWKKSGKTGKMYKQYMNEEISRAVSKELNVVYTEPKKK